MVTLANGGAWLINGAGLILDGAEAPAAVKAALGHCVDKEEAKNRRSHTVFWKTIIPPAAWKS